MFLDFFAKKAQKTLDKYKLEEYNIYVVKAICFTTNKKGGDFALAKDYKFALLLDYYGDMLTEKQRNVLDLYYNEDMSLAEIAEHERITRQGVHDSIHRGEQLLDELESKLCFSQKMRAYENALEEIDMLAQNIYGECRMYNYSKNILSNAETIMQRVKDLNE